MSRLARILFLAAVALCVAAPPTSAAPAQELPVDDTLGALWTTVLETPTDENPFGAGGSEFACLDLGRNTVAPFAPGGVESCTVKPGTKIFAATSVECSTFPGDAPPRDPGY